MSRRLTGVAWVVALVLMHSVNARALNSDRPNILCSQQLVHLPGHAEHQSLLGFFGDVTHGVANGRLKEGDPGIVRCRLQALDSRRRFDRGWNPLERQGD